MYEGRTRFSSGRFPARRIVVNRRTGLAGVVMSPGEAAYLRATSAPKMEPTAYDLSETSPGVYGRQVPNTPYPPTKEYDYPLAEVTVTGTRTPWWMWGLGGALAFAALHAFKK